MLKKYRPLIYTLAVFSLLLFLWWFSGGSLVYGLKRTPPAVQATAFIFKNFQAGTALILNGIANFLGR